jgi:hypothetical protein
LYEIGQHSRVQRQRLQHVREAAGDVRADRVAFQRAGEQAGEGRCGGSP